MEQLEKDLASLVEAINKGVDKTTKELGQKSLDYIKKQYAENNMGSHVGNINLKAKNKRYKYGFVISSGNDEVAVYNEFGTGVVGAGTNPLADEAGYEYNVNTPHKGTIPEGAIKQYGIEYCEANTTNNTWWYWKNGSWRHTEGMVGKNMYVSLVDELRDNAVKDFKASVSQTIGSYGGK